jgi:hypothetical protein
MVLPLLPLIATGLAGAAGGSLASSALSKKGSSTTTTTYHPYSTYSPSQANSYNIQYPSYQVQIDSPLASQTTKKEQTSKATAESSPAVTAGEGTDLSMIIPVALILGGAYVLKGVLK